MRVEHSYKEPETVELYESETNEGSNNVSLIEMFKSVNKYKNNFNKKSDSQDNELFKQNNDKFNKNIC